MNIDKILLNNYRIEITDDVNESTKHSLLEILKDVTKVKIGKILGFIESDLNTSYSKTKNYSKNIYKGTYDDLHIVLSIMIDVGFHKGSRIAINDERTALNKIVDKKALELAIKILKLNNVNHQNAEYPHSGLISAIQSLRLKGFSDDDILSFALNNRIADIALKEYDVKRDVKDSSTFQRIINKNFTNEDIVEALKWDK